MPGICGGNPDHGDDTTQAAQAGGKERLWPALQIPKNRSTGNLGAVGDNSDKARIRFSFDAGAAAAEYDAMSRSSIMTDHDHGLGMSGLRRIRQQHYPMRAPTIPSSSSRSPSLASLTRTPSVSVLLEPHVQSIPLSPGPISPAFTEDLSRFPSESLHSFSFAHQSEDLIHSRQNVLKRSIEFMKDKKGWTASSNAAIASAQARVTGDVEMQSMLDLLAKANLVGAGNIPNGDTTLLTGPLTGPAATTNENVFEKGFAPRTDSPEPMDRTPFVSPTTHAPPPLPAPTDTWGPGRDASSSTSDARQPSLPGEGAGSEASSRTPTNESGTTAQTAQTSQTSPPPSRRPSVLKRTMTEADTVQISVQQKLVDVMARPFLAVDMPSPQQQPQHRLSQPFVSALSPPPAAVAPAAHAHPTRWVPAAQAIFTTESKSPWTIHSANDIACLLFGVTTAEVRKMGILEVVQEERRAWIMRKLHKGMRDDAGDGTQWGSEAA